MITAPFIDSTQLYVQVAGDYMSVAGQESAVVAGVKAAQRLLNR